MYDTNTRPLKRQCTHSISTSPMPRSSSFTPPPDSPMPALRLLPPAILLLALPGLLALPPTHLDFGFSLFLSLRSLRQCLALPALAPDYLAEVGMRVMESGSQEGGCDWAVGIHSEVEKALSKGLLIAQKVTSFTSAALPSPHSSILILHLSSLPLPHLPKFARAILRRLIVSFLPSDPLGIVYALHHSRIIFLTHVIRLRVLLRAGAWAQVGPALDTAEAMLGLIFNKDGKIKNDKGNINAIVNAKPDDDALPHWNSITAHDVNAPSREYSQVHINHSDVEPKQEEESTQSDPAHASFVIHTLLSGTIFCTFSGNIRAAEQRLIALHKIVDSGALEGFKDDSSPSAPSSSSPYHPLILLLLTFLVSATAKRDPVGRNPKRRLCAEAAISILNTKREDIELPLWASLADRDKIIQRAVRLTADLLCELVAISRPHQPSTSTLHATHLAHAFRDTERAGVCYRVAKSMDDERNAAAGYVGAAACAGEALLRIGLCAQAQAHDENSNTVVNEDASSDNSGWLDAETYAVAGSAIKRCHGMGGMREAVGKVMQAAVAGTRGEIVGARSHLKTALSLSTLAGENHLHALLLAQVGAQYLHMAPTHATETLAVCKTLGAGIGAKQKDVNGGNGKGKEKKNENDTDGGNGSISNAPLRLLIFKCTNKLHRVAKQEVYNAMYRGTVERMVGRAGWPSAMESDDDEKGPADSEDVKMQDLDRDRDVEM
ncbi:hypothetical protein DFJ58DRAFT_870225, partial [Suillus subalutaceus]|uniref:uncharacterized protein n=1 Tax=Suillus subalutaceus TaxID=48586 RepID=UPI001B86D357